MAALSTGFAAFSQMVIERWGNGLNMQVLVMFWDDDSAYADASQC